MIFSFIFIYCGYEYYAFFISVHSAKVIQPPAGLLKSQDLPVDCMHVKAVVHGTIKSGSVSFSHPDYRQDVGYPSSIEPHHSMS